MDVIATVFKVNLKDLVAEQLSTVQCGSYSSDGDGFTVHTLHSAKIDNNSQAIRWRG